MDGGKSRGCNTSPVMDNASSLIACDGKYNDFHTSVDVKLGPPFFPCAPCVNTIPGMVERRIHASELAKLVGEPDAIVNETNEISVEDGAGKMVAKEEHIAFPGLSPLRGDVVGSSSSIGIGLEAEYASGAFDHGRDSSDCEKSLFVSSRFFVDSLVDSDGDLAKKRCGFCCPTISSERLVISRNSHKNQAQGSNHSSPVGESQSLNFDRCSENESCPETIIKGDSQQPCSQIGQGLTLQYVRKQKQARQKVSCTSLHENDINHQELTEEESFPQADHEVSCSAQGSNSEPTYFSATERFISENPSHSSTLACCSSGVPETDIMKSNFDASKGSSTCCSSSICCEEAERVNVALKKPVFLSVIKRSNPKRAASLRGSLPIANSNELTIIRKGRRKCRRKGRREEITSTLSLVVINMFSEVKRKRRSSQRQARLSAWGNVEELFNIIKQYNESERNDSEPSVFEKRGSKKVKSGGNRRKRNPALKSENSQFSSIKKASSSSKTVAPILFDAKASFKKNIGHLMPASDGHTSLGFSDSKFQFGQNLAEKCCGTSFRSIQRYGQRGDKDLNSTLTQETSADTHQFDFHGVLSQFDPRHVAATIDAKLFFDSGTSPDSDVYNPPANVQSLSPEGSTAIKQDGGLDQKVIIEESKTEDGLLCSAVAYAGPVAESSSVLEKEIQVCESSSRRNSKSSQKGGKLKSGKKDGLMSKRIFPFSYHLSVEGRLDFLKKHNEVRKALVSSNCCQKDQPASRGVKCSKSVRKKYRRGSKSETIPLNSSLPSWDDLNCSGQFLEVQTNTGASTITLENVSNEQSGAIVTFGDVEGCQIPTSADIKGCLISRSSKMSLNKGKSSRAHSANNKKKFSHLQTGKVRKSDNTKKAEPFFEENSSLVLSQEINSKLSVSGGELSADVGESTGISTVLKDASDCVATSVSSELSAREIYSSLLERPLLSSKKAWALCDDCQKWRCVPDELVHVIEKNRWTCRDNVDEAFADCAIPQEKTDEEINIDLGISDEYCFAGQPSYLQIEPQRTAARRTTWGLIKSNLYRHRNRRTQTIDEVMVCHCKPSHDGSLGCADECLNRVLNIECVKGTCPCGDLCSNQQFQKRKYAKFKWIHCGKKGYGLQLEEDVRQGQFLIEYVGEVLDIPAYEARLSDYASRGQKHFYFMTLNGGEVIDACGKGNLGRFINHSCDPNCRTEKWMVKGEVCIGLFAIRDIKKVTCLSC
ncbi:Histone-lysine N-methyltransferase ASHH2 [Apostasia shenzhenica]|uniref:Histone-lysine N-methyltransferase ASHH2 n=1 Tax=Apostasia shenzhenica TaxID=1088818 RepID=A0A2I0BG62_9ASPA|nr:Histone-lysine N-methyltransferase ASHH2 [Apostasia shenzhenica]